MSQTLQIDEWSKFYQVVQEIGKHNFGKPEKPYPRCISFQKTDKHFPPDSVMQMGHKAIRKYWNDKNLKKRKANMTKSKKSFINNSNWKVEITETQYS